MRKLYLFVAAILLLAACGSDDPGTVAEVGQADTARWRVAVLPTLDCLPLFVAHQEGYFSEEGLSVGLRLYDAQMDVDTALAGGSVVAGVTDLARVEHMQQQGLRLRCVTSTDAYWQLFSMRTARISKLAQLDDKMVAMTRYSATDLLSDRVVDSARLKPERVFRIQVNSLKVRLGMLESGIMDAMFLPEPHATAARRLKAHELYDTRQDSLWMGCVAFVEDSLKGHDGDLSSFLRAYDRAVDSLNVHGIQHFRDILEYWLGLPAVTIDSLPGRMQFRHASLPRPHDVGRVRQWWEKRVASTKYVEKRYLQ